MQQYVVIGLGSFGRSMIEELFSIGEKVLIIDKNKDKIGTYKSKSSSAYIIDITSPDALKKIVPEDIAAAIVDLGRCIEPSIIAVNSLRKMNIKKILVRAETDEHAEILKIVGASQVFFPHVEAAKRVVTTLLSPAILNHMPIAGGMAIAEIRIPKKLIGKTVAETSLGNEYKINLIAGRKNTEDGYVIIPSDHRIESDDLFLVAGEEKDIARFSGYTASGKTGISAFFMRVLKK